MNPEEMERQMLNSSRAARLGFMEAKERALLKTSVQVLGGVWRYLSSAEPRRISQATFIGDLVNEEDECFELTGRVDASNPPEQLNIVIPYDLVRSVWVDSGGQLTVLLSVRLMYVNKTLTFETIGT